MWLNLVLISGSNRRIRATMMMIARMNSVVDYSTAMNLAAERYRSVVAKPTDVAVYYTFAVAEPIDVGHYRFAVAEPIDVAHYMFVVLGPIVAEHCTCAAVEPSDAGLSLVVETVLSRAVWLPEGEMALWYEA